MNHSSVLAQMTISLLVIAMGAYVGRSLRSTGAFIILAVVLLSNFLAFPAMLALPLFASLTGWQCTCLSSVFSWGHWRKSIARV